MSTSPIYINSEDERSMVWRAFNIENEPGTMTLVKMNAVLVVSWSVGDVVAANGIMDNTKFMETNLHLFPYIGIIFDDKEKPFICYDNNS